MKVVVSKSNGGAGGRDCPDASMLSVLRDARAGRPVIVTGAPGQEANLVVAAELVTSELLAFMVRHTSGFVCVALPGAVCKHLQLPPMYPLSDDPRRGAFTVTVDAMVGVTTGISASDRARTIRLLGQADTVAGDLARPGHVVPCRVADGGVLARLGAAEAASDLARVAGLRPAAVYSAIVSEWCPGDLAHGAELAEFAARHGLGMLLVDDLAAYRRGRLAA